MLLGNACRAREFWHRRMPLLADAVRPQHLEQGQQENLDVEPKAPVVHIPDVKIEFLFPGDRVPAVDLRPAGNAWLNLVTPTLVRAVARQVLGQQWSRSHKAHFTSENVPDLRQLVETTAAQEAPENRQALSIGQENAVGIAGICHRTELEKRERLVSMADASLSKQDRLA